jgi:hypothetical protein
MILAEFEMQREQFGLQEDAVISFLEYVEQTWVGCRMGQSHTSLSSLFHRGITALAGRSF